MPREESWNKASRDLTDRVDGSRAISAEEFAAIESTDIEMKERETLEKLLPAAVEAFDGVEQRFFDDFENPAFAPVKRAYEHLRTLLRSKIARIAAATVFGTSIITGISEGKDIEDYIDDRRNANSELERQSNIFKGSSGWDDHALHNAMRLLHPHERECIRSLAHDFLAQETEIIHHNTLDPFPRHSKTLPFALSEYRMSHRFNRFIEMSLTSKNIPTYLLQNEYELKNLVMRHIGNETKGLMDTNPEVAIKMGLLMDANIFETTKHLPSEQRHQLLTDTFNKLAAPSANGEMNIDFELFLRRMPERAGLLSLQDRQWLHDFLLLELHSKQNQKSLVDPNIDSKKLLSEAIHALEQ